MPVAAPHIDMQRLQTLCNDHREGLSLRRAGEPWGLSAQRVRTILTQQGHRIGYDYWSRSFTPHPAQIPFLED